jgi:hypothetical protein
MIVIQERETQEVDEKEVSISEKQKSEGNYRRVNNSELKANNTPV